MAAPSTTPATPIPNLTEHTEPQRMSWAAYHEWALRTQARAEWVDGDVVGMTKTSIAQHDLVFWLHQIIHHFVKHHRLGRVFAQNISLYLPSRPSDRLPAIMYVAHDNPSAITATHLRGWADLVVEVVSPGAEDQRRDLIEKFAEYESGGIREYWAIDQANQVGYFYQRDAAGKFLLAEIGPNELYRSPALPGFWLQVDWLWQVDRPDSDDVRRLQGTLV